MHLFFIQYIEHSFFRVYVNFFLISNFRWENVCKHKHASRQANKQTKQREKKIFEWIHDTGWHFKITKSLFAHIRFYDTVTVNRIRNKNSNANSANFKWNQTCKRTMRSVEQNREKARFCRVISSSRASNRCIQFIDIALLAFKSKPWKERVRWSESDRGGDRKSCRNSESNR